MPSRAFLNVPAWRRFNLKAEEVRRVAFIEDDKNLRKHTAAICYLKQDDLVDLRLQKPEFRFGHGFCEWRSGARKLTVDRMTTSLRWL